MTANAPLFYAVKTPPREAIRVGDLVHELHTDRVFRVEAIDDASVTLVRLVRQASAPWTITRAAFDAVVLFGGQGTYVFGKVHRAAP